MAGRTRLTPYGETVPASVWTSYAGVWFRSRLESLWAECFDAAGWRWSYEPQRFYFGERSYLPDFYLYDLDAYLEVKPVFPDFGELFLGKMLAEWSRLPTFFGVGKPWAGEVYCYETVGERLAWREIPRTEFFRS